MSRVFFISMMAAGALAATAELASAAETVTPVSLKTTGPDAEWADLHARAAAGDARAQRRVALMLLKQAAPVRCAADECAADAVDYLKRAARGGDTVALVTLEKMRAEEAAHAPSVEDIVAIETERAERGDKMTAWRLAKRYQTGDGVEPSASQSVRWLTEVASGDSAAYPKTTEAAYRLCEIYGQGAGVPADDKKAQSWCERAAQAGHAGAALVLAQLQRLDG
ncbi:MAG: hypothetical protein VX640_15990 [Pseudomonadota bacterium]|nr:hypothetical protein [Pseudomonadota bacterium]